MKTTIYDYAHPMTPESLEAAAGFLALHLGRFGDPLDEIRLAMEYALRANESGGGFVCVAKQDAKTVGAAVINRTGMTRYIPENQLIYIAIHDKFRGHGLGRLLMGEIINHAQGGIALHVEPENPARYLYQSLGFTSKYLEMRLERKEVEDGVSDAQ